jgi:hypothetical protein
MELPFLKFDEDDGPEAALRLRQEFEESDPRLRALTLEVGHWQYTKWGIPLTITCICRTKDENTAVGGRDMSAHTRRPGQTYHRAHDWRNRDLTESQQAERRDRVAAIFNWKVPMLFHVLDHDSGHGAHTHININYPYMI